MSGRVRIATGLWALVELAVFALVASWIGVGWTILATVATSALGLSLLGRQGTRALAGLRDNARLRRSPGRALGDAGLVAVGGLLMVLPGFLGDLVGLLCLVPLTRPLPRAVATRIVGPRLPDALRGPVRVQSVRTERVRVPGEEPEPGLPVIEGEVVDRPPDGSPSGR